MPSNLCYGELPELNRKGYNRYGYASYRSLLRRRRKLKILRFVYAFFGLRSRLALIEAELSELL